VEAVSKPHLIFDTLDLPKTNKKFRSGQEIWLQGKMGTWFTQSTYSAKRAVPGSGKIEHQMGGRVLISDDRACLITNQNLTPIPYFSMPVDIRTNASFPVSIFGGSVGAAYLTSYRTFAYFTMKKMTKGAKRAHPSAIALSLDLSALLDCRIRFSYIRFNLKRILIPVTRCF